VPHRTRTRQLETDMGGGHVSLHDGSPLGDRSPSHCACVILRHCRLLSTAKPRACVTTTDPFSIMEKSDESQLFDNVTMYLKTKKMSQWTKQMRWRIKKSLPSFVSYVDVEPYAVSRLQHNMLTFKPFTTLLNITLNKPTLCVKTSPIC